jgi:murein DD-endopeptidase MepM/ murein hydrolase activator NlpD
VPPVTGDPVIGPFKRQETVLLNASVGMQRVLGRLPPTQRATSKASRPLDVHPLSSSPRTRAATGTSARSAAPGHRVILAGRFGLRGAIRSHVGPEALLPAAVILIVIVATFASWMPGALGPGSVGGPDGDGTGPRLAVAGFAGSGAGGTDGSGPTDDGSGQADTYGTVVGSDAGIAGDELGGPSDLDPNAGAIRGPFLQDGTLVKPMAVDTSIADGSGLLKTYKVRAGDTLTGIAHRFGVSVKTIWWANNLSSRASVHAGQTLTIPPVDGVVVSVAEGDTLDSIAAKYEVDLQAIYDLNGLEDSSLVLGQTLILPGAVGTSIPNPVSKSKPVSRPSSGTVRPPATYGGGKMSWPVVGGNNFISQYFHAGHYAIDIAADYGTRVVAAASGTVIFAGWKANGGGYQVWIAHGSGIFTTYNHMSAITVGIGQSVGRGGQVGRIGQTGNATGPHLHFEVWRGPVWDGGTRVNPLGYL